MMTFIKRYFSLVLMILLVACTVEQEPVEITRVVEMTAVALPTAAIPATAAASPTHIINPDTLQLDQPSTAIPAATPTFLPFTPVPTAVPTATENAIPITETPIFQGGEVVLLDWSPDGRYLAYFEYTDEALNGLPHYRSDAEGTFTIYDTATDTKCQDYPISGRSDDEGLNLGRRHLWLPNGDLFMLTKQGDAFQVAAPCQEQASPLFTEPFRYIADFSPDQSTLVLASWQGYWFYNWQEQKIWAIDPEIMPLHATAQGADSILAWSPDGRYLAITSMYQMIDPVDGTWKPVGGTWMVEAATGVILAYHDWPVTTLLALSNPIWLNSEEVLMATTRGGEPFFMTVTGEIRPLLPLFPSISPDFYPHASVYVSSDSYHIIVSYAESTAPPPQIYHSDTGEVEMLAPTNTPAEVRPDGQVIADSNQGTYLMRPITAVGEPLTRVPWLCYPDASSPVTAYYTRLSDARYIHIYRAPDCTLIASLDLGRALQEPAGIIAIFSPNNEWLAAAPSKYSGSSFALFVLSLAEVLP